MMKDQEFEQKLLDMKLQDHGLISKEEQEEAWKEITLEIAAKEKPKSSSWWLVAASIAMIVAVGWWVMPKAENLYVTNQSEQLDIQLEDKSIVTLNRNSSLTVSNDFNESKRVVRLKGEAFFNIEKNREKPFIIDMGNRQVTVLGTSFLVKHKGRETTVSVRTGTVLLTSDNSTQTLEANQKARIAEDGKIVEQEWYVNDFAWYSGTLNFENKSMKEVAEILSQLSAKPVAISQSVTDCKLSLKIDYERIEEVFDIIAETLEISWNEEPKRIYFDGKGC